MGVMVSLGDGGWRRGRNMGRGKTDDGGRRSGDRSARGVRTGRAAGAGGDPGVGRMEGRGGGRGRRRGSADSEMDLHGRGRGWGSARRGGSVVGSDKTTGGKNTERTGNKNTKERLKLDGGDIDAIEELVRRRLVLGSGERGERRDTSFIFSNCWFVRLGMVREGSAYVLL